MRAMRLMQRLFRPVADRRTALLPLYRLIVAEARRPDHYAAGGVPDTLDGRFAMVAHVLALVLLRLEREGDTHREASALLTECFIADMDGTLREMGIGDVVVGKQIGKMMGALGGTLGALRQAFADAGRNGLSDALARNLYAGTPPAAAMLADEQARLEQLQAALEEMAETALIAGEWPAL